MQDRIPHDKTAQVEQHRAKQDKINQSIKQDVRSWTRQDITGQDKVGQDQQDKVRCNNTESRNRKNGEQGEQGKIQGKKG